VSLGSCDGAVREALDLLRRRGMQIDYLRVRAFPFGQEVEDFLASHSQIFVVEQNRDAQLRMLLVNEGAIDPLKLISVVHFDGTPITARFITKEIEARLTALNVIPLRRTVP
jgi:2-oxoglutarate ferredoxin oxidoreductase subunit alpha